MKALWSELLSTVSQHLQWIRACELHRPSPHTSRPRQNCLMCRRVNCQICSAAGEYKIILLVLPYCVKSAESNLFSPLSHYLEHKTLLITWIRRVGWSWYLSFSTTKITFSLCLLSFRQKHLERLQKSAVKDSLELLVMFPSLAVLDWVFGIMRRSLLLNIVQNMYIDPEWVASEYLKRCKKGAWKKENTVDALKCFNLERILTASQFNLETPDEVGMEKYMEGFQLGV